MSLVRDAVIWTGPVAFWQVPGATIPGAHEVNIGCFGDKPPHCPSIGETSLDGSGRRLPSLLAKHGLSEDQVGHVVFGGFSAGGSLIKRVLQSPADRARVSAVHLADATYTSSWDAPGRPPVIEGFAAYGVDAATGPHLLVATASPIPNKNWASGVQNLQRLREEIETRTGQKFQKLDHFFGIDPAPEAAYQLGNVILAEYPMTPLGHGHTKIAGQVWDKIVLPFLGQAGIPSGPPPGPGPDEPPWVVPTPPPPIQLAASRFGIFAVGAALAFGATYLIGRG